MNKLSGTLPPELSGCRSLESLYVDSTRTNEFGHEITNGCVCVCPLRLLHTNKLTGTIPDSFGNLSNLLELYVMFQPCGDSLNHSLNHSLAHRCSHDSYLYWNQISGTIPASLGNIPTLKWMYVL